MLLNYFQKLETPMLARLKANVKLSLLKYLIFIGIFYGCLILCIGLNHSYWGDEEHFYQTIRYFGNQSNIHGFLNYDQVTGPYVFFIYSLIGRLINFDISTLRLFNVFISIVTFYSIYKLYKYHLKKDSLVWVASIWILVNPYMVGLSFFVFTDMLTLGQLVLFSIGVRNKNNILILLSGTFMLLSRQYAVFAIVAAGLFHLILFAKGERQSRQTMMVLFICTIPLLFLFWYWKGIAPPAGIKKWITVPSTGFNFTAITTYITFAAFFLLPFIGWYWKKYFLNLKILLVGGLISSWYYFFPVSSSLVTLAQTTHTTVGLAHRFIQSNTNPVMENLVLWFGFFIGLIVLLNILIIDFKRLKSGHWDYMHFLSLLVFLFLLVMPFSYQVWEKYLITILPFLLLRMVIPNEYLVEESFAPHSETLKRSL